MRQLRTLKVLRTMIHSVAQMLDAIASREKEILGEEKITHTVTIGNMYEGPTRELLDKAIPSALNLSVAQGLIEDAHGDQSREIDCMLVDGPGREIPRSTRRIYALADVVAGSRSRRVFVLLISSAAAKHC